MKIINAFLFLLFFFIHGFSQELQQAALKDFSEKFPQEKIHVMLHKKSFLAGDDLFFKIFVIEGFKPSTISSSVFVEILDANKKVISKKFLPVYNGESSGNIKLNENLEEGVYFFRAYTTWMLNFNEKFQWLKPVVIYNPKSKLKIVENTSPDFDATLHPESGNLVQNVSTKIAVRLQGNLNKNWNGFLFDANRPQEKLVEFNSLDENVAQFILKPEFGINYKVSINNNGVNKVFDLPIVKKNGLSLQVNSKNEVIEFSLIEKDENTPRNYKIFGQINHRMVFMAKVSKPNPEKIYKIPTQQLVNGILQLTVFDENNQMLAERLCFVEPTQLNIEKPNLETENLNTEPRKLNSFSLSPQNTVINYTIGIFDENSTTTEEINNLPSTIWLTGDIASEIANPAQYFSTNSNAKALDALLITEKWHRMDWKSILSGVFPKIIYQPYAYISYKGKATLDNATARNVILDMTFKAKNSTQFFQVPTDNKGEFVLENLVFDDSLDIYYQLNNKKLAKNSTLKVFFQPLLYPVEYSQNLPKTNFLYAKTDDLPPKTEEATRLIEENNFYKDLKTKEVEIEGVSFTVTRELKTQKLNDQLSTEGFKAINETVFDFVNGDPLFGDMLNWLQGKIPGLQFNRDIIGMVPKLNGKEMEIYLNEFLIPAESLSSINASEVAMIKVIRPPFFGASGNGAIAIYLNNNAQNNKAKSSNSGVNSLDSKNLIGFDKVESFISKNYSAINPENISQDKRIVMYWKTDVFTNKNEKKVIEFYNNDSRKSPKIIIVAFDDFTKKFIYYHHNLQNQNTSK